MRRLPVYFLVDVSESMVGDPIKQVTEGMNSIIRELRTDPYALETVFISVIVFAGKAQSLLPLTELYSVVLPDFPVGSGTSIGAGLECLMADLSKSLVKTTREVKGDWKPIVFVFTDGVPTDKPHSVLGKWEKEWRGHCNTIAISIGYNADLQVLGRLSDNVLRLKEMDKDAFMSFFKWVTASIRTSSVSVNESNRDEMSLPKPDGINLEKVKPGEKNRTDENYMILSGRCSKEGKPYLVKYVLDDACMHGDRGPAAMADTRYKYIGTYPVEDESYKNLSDGNASKQKVNSERLENVPVSCPICGNELGTVLCGCGGIMCASSKGGTSKCPWCGTEGELQLVESLDYSRELG